MRDLAERLSTVRESAADATRQAGREPSEITIVAVTKFQPPALVRELVALGQHDIGENRHQEAAPKAAVLAGLDIRWHFVGQLQSKKARQVVTYSRFIHSVDRPSLVGALESSAVPVDCFIQLNLTDDPGRGGVAPGDLDALVDMVAASSSLTLLGLMAVAPNDGDPRASFSRVRLLSDRVRTVVPGADKLSMGMSGDYLEAILEGATHLRIGTAITGNRPAPG